LQEFWDKCSKDDVKSHKLKVAISSGDTPVAKRETSALPVTVEEAKVQPSAPVVSTPHQISPTRPQDQGNVSASQYEKAPE
jgi:hypothetical protein